MLAAFMQTIITLMEVIYFTTSIMALITIVIILMIIFKKGKRL